MSVNKSCLGGGWETIAFGVLKQFNVGGRSLDASFAVTMRDAQNERDVHKIQRIVDAEAPALCS